MLVGALGAMNQKKMKRLLAYSSIGHVGYLLIGLCCGTVEGIQALLINLSAKFTLKPVGIKRYSVLALERNRPLIFDQGSCVLRTNTVRSAPNDNDRVHLLAFGERKSDSLNELSKRRSSTSGCAGAVTPMPGASRAVIPDGTVLVSPLEYAELSSAGHSAGNPSWPALVLGAMSQDWVVYAVRR